MDVRETREYLKSNLVEYIFSKYKIRGKHKKKIYHVVRGLFTTKFNEMGYICYRTFKLGLGFILLSFIFLIPFLYVLLEGVEDIEISYGLVVLFGLPFVAELFIILCKLRNMREEVRQYVELGRREDKEVSKRKWNLRIQLLLCLDWLRKKWGKIKYGK